MPMRGAEVSSSLLTGDGVLEGSEEESGDGEGTGDGDGEFTELQLPGIL